eukprot:GFUD01033086.1.p1 GENE.GFUD01033086.1~~GFUD01033086.1.p1  ORF type:complete len:647 (-),score=306.09 GFUD01033086.1:446-2386(-)
MKKSMEKLKVRIDQNLNRTEKSVALPPELEKIEETILTYRQVCQTVHKKFSECLQGAGKGTDGQSIERRLKKTLDFSLGQSLSEQGRLLTKQSSSSCLGQVLQETGGVCTAVGQNLVQYEISVEQLVVQELETVLKTDLPTILKERRQLDQLILELDTAKARLHTARQEDQNQGGPLTGAKVDRMEEELDDMARKVEQARDLLATDMMAFMSKDAELAKLIAKFLDFKLDYHSSIADQVLLTQPKVDAILLTKRGFPIFGSSLASHLASFPLHSGIAFPLQLCITRLVRLGLEEEGLFRLAAGSSKVKKLRAELEAGLCSLPSLETADHHVLTATIKSYLRELPDPLMGADLYQDWVETGQLDEEDRFDAIWNLLQHEQLPRENYRNIQYLFKFLHAVSSLEEKNKMSASNLAIVITPNVIWECESVHDPLDVTVGSALAQVVELIITKYEWFFQNDASLPWDHLLPTSPLGLLCQPPSTSSPFHPSPVPTTRDRKGKGKKAPPPPSTDFSSPSSSPSPSRVTSSPSHLPSPATLPHSESPQTGHQPNNTNGQSSYQRSKSAEGGKHKTASQPPNQPPPSPPQPTPSLPTPSLYPDLPPQDRTFPIPAPRSVKPAIPSKPEGITRNASMRGADQARILQGKESTDL